jgi:hypothetical protein
MNRLTDIFKNRSLVWDGLRNKVFKKEHVEAVYNERLEICNACDKIDIEGSKCAVPGTNPCCSECGCSLSLKLRSLASECPLNKWTALMSNQDESFVKKVIEDNEV